MEENKPQEPEAKKSQEVAKMWGKIILGIVFIVLGLVALIRWWPSLWMVIKGCVGPFLILAGIITIAIAKE
jgi:uncharacterized membrane protein HdeD (DUF308 family)